MPDGPVSARSRTRMCCAILLISFAVSLLTACSGSPGRATSSGSAAPMSASARRFVLDVLAVMRVHWILASSVDWTRVRRTVFEFAAGAQTAAATYAAIDQTIFDFGDPHSGIDPPSAGSGPSAAAMPTGTLLAGRIGSVSVPSLTAAQPADAQRLQTLIAGLARRGACRWVVDVRTDTGGDLWIMLAGLAPLLTHGVVGYFVTADQRRQGWTVRPRSAAVDGVTQASVASPARLETDQPVAILTGPQTASSGEAVVIAFRGQDRTRTFGAPTRGCRVPGADTCSPVARRWS